MEANPLTSSGTAHPPGGGEADQQRVINLVSNVPANQVVGLDGFLQTFNSAEARAEVTPFRYVIQRKVRRNMGGKFSKGLTQEVTENVEINPNEDLFGLRRWLGGIRQDPASVMLLQINKVKEEALAAPLVFSELLKTGRPILVTGADRTTQDQLLARIDLTCSRLPEAVVANPGLKDMLTARAQRRKGFISSIRPLLDLDGLPQALTEKLSRINAGGDPTELSEAELVNITLLADLLSRYRHCLAQYRETLQNGSLSMQQIVSMFEILTADLPIKTAGPAFADFLTDEDVKPEQIRNKGELFGYLNRYLQASDGSSRGASRTEKFDHLFKRLSGLVIHHRAKVDPLLWERCSFVRPMDGAERAFGAKLEPVQVYLSKVAGEGPGAVTKEFKQNLGGTVFELVQAANVTYDQARQDSGALERQRVAQRLLPLFRMQKFQAGHLCAISEQNRPTLLNKEKFLNLFSNIAMEPEDLQAVAERLHYELYPYETVSDHLRRSTLDVLIGHARDREKALREIYLVNAVQDLVTYPFHLGEHNLSSVERLCGLSVLQGRFGFEVYPTATRPNSVGLFVEGKEHPPLGKLQNEPALISRAYTALIAMQVEHQVRKAVDHKIGYLQNTFGDNFFEVIYQQVVTRHDLPLSRNQLAWFVQNRGLLGSLMQKGWRAEGENDLVDPFMTLEDLQQSLKKKGGRDFREFDNFERDFNEASRRFKELLNDLKGAAGEDTDISPRALLWQLYKKGVYNLNRPEAREVMRKSAYYGRLKDAIAQVSSENYSVFTRDLQQEGVKLYVVPALYPLLSIGMRFSFLVENRVVRYQLLRTPQTDTSQLDPASRVFNEKLQELLESKGDQETVRLKAMADEAQRCTEVWWEYSRHLAFALLDRVLTETVIEQLKPGRIQPQHLWYVKDSAKLCLGPAFSASQKSVPFTKVLQNPENMGSLQKNPQTASTTIDDFTSEVHKIERLRGELGHIEGVAEDVLDIIQNLTYLRSESGLVAKYEQGLQRLIGVLDKPLRHFGEKDVQALHTVASALRETLRAFYNSPGAQKDQLVSMVQNQLRARRSDGHQLRLNFTDAFILDKTQIKVMEKREQDGETVSRQTTREVEVEAQYQTLAARVREVIRTHELLERKRHVVFSPEGQKRKQLDYVMDIINTLLALQGNKVTFYVDSSMLSEEQMQRLATRVKPHHFFKMDELKPEAPEGASEAGVVRDPLSGRMVRRPDAAQEGGQDGGAREAGSSA